MPGDAASGSGVVDTLDDVISFPEGCAQEQPQGIALGLRDATSRDLKWVRYLEPGGSAREGEARWHMEGSRLHTHAYPGAPW